ncbi:MAG: TolC family protein [Steroidobacteraceae bacterium]
MHFRHSLLLAPLAGAMFLCPSTPVQAQEHLTLARVQRLALESQPLVDAQAAEVEARRERAIAAGQLPDPELQFAINELPVDTADAWSFRRDSDTDVMVSVMQSYPLAAKRKLRRLREEARTAEAEQELRDLVRTVRRDAGLTYLEVFVAHEAAELTQSQLAQVLLQHEVAQIQVATGSSVQSDLLATTVEAALLRDKVVEYQQMLAHKRLELSRWIGDSAQGEIADDLPMPTLTLSLDNLLANLRMHPTLLAQEHAEEGARTGLELARQGYKPDWRMELGYGYRPEFSEMLTLRVSVGLPLFTRNRQDREAAAARHDLVQASAGRADRLRVLTTEASLRHHDARLYEERLAIFRKDAVPAAHARVDSAQESYRAGRGSLIDVLVARRSLLETEMQVLSLRAEAMRNRIELDYFVTSGDQP